MSVWDLSITCKTRDHCFGLHWFWGLHITFWMLLIQLPPLGVRITLGGRNILAFRFLATMTKFIQIQDQPILWFVSPALFIFADTTQTFVCFWEKQRGTLANVSAPIQQTCKSLKKMKKKKLSTLCMYTAAISYASMLALWNVDFRVLLIGFAKIWYQSKYFLLS